jgi:prepilin-type N-terminal cleavage/methylation domain-containing protein
MRVEQSGFSLIEMIMVTALMSLIGVWSASAWVQQSEDAASEALARWLTSVKESVDQMLVRQADHLTGLSDKEATSKDYQDVWRPSINELIRAGHLSGGFSLRPPLGYEVSIRLVKPSGLCLTRGCKLEALTIATPQHAQLHQAGTMTRLGKVLASLGGRGASVTPLSPQRVRGPMLDMPNPPGADMAPLPIGSIVLHSFYDSSALISFLRQGERRDVQLDAKLDVVGPFSAGGGVTARGRVSSGEHLQLAAVANQGTGCEAEGLIAQSSATGLLVCQGGIWQNSAKSGGGHFIDSANSPCHAPEEVNIDRRNPMTGDCTCPKGYKPSLLSVWRYPFHSYNEFYTYLCIN